MPRQRPFGEREEGPVRTMDCAAAMDCFVDLDGGVAPDVASGFPRILPDPLLTFPFFRNGSPERTCLERSLL